MRTTEVPLQTTSPSCLVSSVSFSWSSGSGKIKIVRTKGPGERYLVPGTYFTYSSAGRYKSRCKKIRKEINQSNVFIFILYSKICYVFMLHT